MSSSQSLAYRLAADGVLLLHVAFVMFVIAGLALTVAGRFFRWGWVRKLWCRVAHLLAIGVVVAQSWADVVCPLTTIEMTLRSKAGEATYAGSFIAHWLEALLYFNAPAWVFAMCYSIFAALVVATWLWIPPRRAR